jgi:hypothetical protein
LRGFAKGVLLISWEFFEKKFGIVTTSAHFLEASFSPLHLPMSYITPSSFLFTLFFQDSHTKAPLRPGVEVVFSFI